MDLYSWNYGDLQIKIMAVHQSKYVAPKLELHP